MKYLRSLAVRLVFDGPYLGRLAPRILAFGLNAKYRKVS